MDPENWERDDWGIIYTSNGHALRDIREQKSNTRQYMLQAFTDVHTVGTTRSQDITAAAQTPVEVIKLYYKVREQ
jgi:hypothetical protein